LIDIVTLGLDDLIKSLFGGGGPSAAQVAAHNKGLIPRVNADGSINYGPGGPDGTGGLGSNGFAVPGYIYGDPLHNNHARPTIFNCPDASGHDPCMNTWVQSNCVVNKPFKTAADDIKTGITTSAFIGGSAALHSGARNILGGVFKQVSADAVGFVAIVGAWSHGVFSAGHAVLYGCKDD
jgi:hypothetical protein